jgi:hypothetical protein
VGGAAIVWFCKTDFGFAKPCRLSSKGFDI